MEGFDDHFYFKLKCDLVSVFFLAAGKSSVLKTAILLRKNAVRVENES